MEREESRYAHLLAPIRDLAQNWHTDIAAELSDYLSQLEELTFTFDGGDTNLNFAEGACASAEAVRAGDATPGRGGALARQSPDAPTPVSPHSGAAHPGQHVRVLTQGGVPPQAGVQRPGSGRHQEVRFAEDRHRVRGERQ